MTTNDESFHAFRWKAGHMTDLGTLNGDPCSGAESSNSKGQIVGDSDSDCAGASRAFLWEKGGPMVDLNSLIPPDSGLFLTEGVFIGEGGEIVVIGVLANGDQHACLLTPSGRDQDGPEISGATVARPDRTLHAQGSRNATSGRLTPETAAALRARFANHHRGIGLRLPKQAQ